MASWWKFVNFYKKSYFQQVRLKTNQVNVPAFLPKWSIGFEDLDNVEKNVVLRNHKNNITHIRCLFKELESENNEDRINELKRYLINECYKLPNFTHPRIVKLGNEPIELYVYIPPQWSSTEKDEFSIIGRRLNLYRMDHLSNYTGHKSYYLMNSLSRLEFALIRFVLSELKKKNFQIITVPDILPSSIIESCGMSTESDRTQVYKLDSGSCLSGTSEMALAGYFENRILDESELPIKVASVSRCYRAETSGLHEEKGIYRVHQFTKAEMFTVCSENQSEAMLESFKNFEISFFKQLAVKFRVLDMPPSELGASAYQKYDIEAWMPGRKMWGEISSCSNCTDYQAKRLNISYRTKDGTIKTAHTINGTAAAIPRLLIALIETNQIDNDRIVLPDVLKSFLNNTTIKKDKRMPEVKLIKYLK